MKKEQLTLLITIFFVGAASLIYETYSIHVLFFYYLKASDIIAIAIAAFLAGLGFSSLFFSWLSHNNKKKAYQLLIYMQLALIAYAYLVLKNYYYIPQILNYIEDYFGGSDWHHFMNLMFMWWYLFTPAFLIGGCFPIINGLYIERKGKITTDTGVVYFYDILGCIIGCLLTGFFLIPNWGLSVTVLVAVVFNLLSLCLMVKRKTVKIFVVITLCILSGREVILYQEDSSLLKLTQPSHILFQKNSPFGVITVGKNSKSQITQQEGQKFLRINDRPMCGGFEGQKSAGAESYLGEKTATNIKEGSKVLAVGLGCGYTARGLVDSQNIQQVTQVEINPVIVEAARDYFSDENKDVVKAPKLNLVIQNGAEFIRTTKEIYDAIVIDIEEVSIIYSSPMFTQDYMRLYEKHLNDDGVFSLWSFYGNPHFSKILYNTIKSVFPYVSMRSHGIHEIVFFASKKPLKDPLIMGPPEEQKRINDVLKNPLSKVNTLDQPILQQYFDTHEIFQLDRAYRERYLQDEYRFGQ